MPETNILAPFTYWPTGRTTTTTAGGTTTRTGTRTLAGVTPEQEAAAAGTAYGALTPGTFGRVSDADMAALRSAYETSVFGKSDAAVNAMAAEAGAAPTGAGNVAALRALPRSTAALPLAEIDYRNRATGATAWGNLALQRALAQYQALTRGQTETFSDTSTTAPGQTEATQFTNVAENPYAPIRPAGATIAGGGGQGGTGVGVGRTGTPMAQDDWWGRNPFDPLGGWKGQAGGGGGGGGPVGARDTSGEQWWANPPAAGGYTDENLGPGGYGAIRPTAPSEAMSGAGLQTSGGVADFANTPYGNILRTAYGKGKRVF